MVTRNHYSFDSSSQYASSVGLNDDDHISGSLNSNSNSNSRAYLGLAALMMCGIDCSISTRIRFGG